ncbi:hypothetical protein HDU83_001110 [Entophlyctis luteolus]|nr:hypothetical protein HDU82_008918 [Entophlyctis luteolus]KAJ3348640.1 hypothetical protein HDU83_001110 [Entophlyctis luteolus]KAJ3387229.1 hypothetical protein HDU84_000951 [Entophlyctis sp. JEL0112]
MSFSNVIVTGANQGIGLEVVRLLSDALPATATVFLGTRSVANGDAALASLGLAKPNVRVLQLDVTSQLSVDAAIDTVKQQTGTVDVLINNAGIGSDDAQSVFAVNVVGVRRMIESLVRKDALGPSARVVTVASQVGPPALRALSTELQALLNDARNLDSAKIDVIAADYVEFFKSDKSEIGNGTFPPKRRTFGAYGISKALVLAEVPVLMRSYPQLSFASVCPGYVATALNGFSGPRTTKQGAQSVVWPLFNQFENGKFYFDGKVVG